nr:MAG TPA: hypothetical protein [Caudoviricetes sp.]
MAPNQMEGLYLLKKRAKPWRVTLRRLGGRV